MSTYSSGSPPAAGFPADATIYRIEPHIYCYALYQNITVAVWVGSATVRSVLSLRGISQHMIDNYPQGHSSVVFILDKIPPPEPEARELASRAFHATTS